MSYLDRDRDERVHGYGHLDLVGLFYRYDCDNSVGFCPWIDFHLIWMFSSFISLLS